jgi:hypothetical protein
MEHPQQFRASSPSRYDPVSPSPLSPARLGGGGGGGGGGMASQARRLPKSPAGAGPGGSWGGVWAAGSTPDDAPPSPLWRPLPPPQIAPPLVSRRLQETRQEQQEEQAMMTRQTRSMSNG